MGPQGKDGRDHTWTDRKVGELDRSNNDLVKEKARKYFFIQRYHDKMLIVR